MGSPIAPTNAFEVTTDKLTFFRHFDKDYLHEQYVVLGKSMNQIAREKGCARSTVGAALADLGFEIKTRGELGCNKGQLSYGERIINGRIVPHLAEQKVIGDLMKQRQIGRSYGAIVDWLNSRQIPTKNKSKKWDRPTVYKMLKRFTDKSFVGPHPGPGPQRQMNLRATGNGFEIEGTRT